ncbi:hypothetical protein MRX96_045697 [Rhipicephalus microplus]
MNVIEDLPAERKRPPPAALTHTGDNSCILYGAEVERCWPACTAYKDPVCQIIHFLPMCNELLFDISMQLREQTSGALSLVSFGSSETYMLPSTGPHSDRVKTFVRWLLKSHVCITSFKLRDMGTTENGRFLFDELSNNTSLKKLTLQFTLDLAVPTHITAILPKLRSLEALSCSTTIRRTGALVNAVSALLRTTTSLTSIVLDAYWNNDQLQKSFFEALAGNSTLKSVELHTFWVSETAQGPLGDYVRSNRLLTNLTLLGDDLDGEELFLDETLVRSGTLSTLEIGNVCGGERTVRVLTNIIAECAVLKKLTVCEVRVKYTNISKATLERFAEALAHNEALKELTLPYTLWHRENWIAFFASLPRNRHLKKLFVSQHGFRDYMTIPPVLEALAYTSTSARVSFEYYIHVPGANLMHSRAFSRIFIHGGELFKVDALQKLPFLDHFTYLALNICEADQRVFAPLAKYLQATKVLRDLHLRLSGPQYVQSDATSPCWSLLFQSILANTSITNIEIVSIDFPYMHTFAHTIGHSRNITRASIPLRINRAIAINFIVSLSEVIGDNYNLVEVQVYSMDLDAERTRCWFTIMETTRRNSGLVERAAAFNQASPLDWYTATALEKVSRYPALLKLLAEKEGIAACEVSRMVRSRLYSVDGLHDFMRLTGVVKEYVTCVPPVGDCSIQLDDLNDDCWRLVRRYLCFDDVKRFTDYKPD